MTCPLGTCWEVCSILDAIVLVAERVSFQFLWRPQLKDPADEMVLETAVNGNADSLATFNLRHLKDAAAQCCASSAAFVVRGGQARGGV